MSRWRKDSYDGRIGKKKRSDVYVDVYSTGPTHRCPIKVVHGELRFRLERMREGVRVSLPFDDADRTEAGDLFGQAGFVHDIDDEVDVLVGLGLFFGEFLTRAG